MPLSHFTKGRMQSSTLNARAVTERPQDTACREAAWCLYQQLPPSEPEVEAVTWASTTLTSETFLNATDRAAESESRTVVMTPYGEASMILRTKVLVGICILGLLGNSLNLLFMTPRILRKGPSMGRITRYSYAGMITLAVSDLNFCVLGIIPIFIEDLRRTSCQLSFSVVYYGYSIALFNLFLLESTWLTVAMAAGRYLAICHPFRAKEWVGMKMYRRSIIVLTLICVAFNIPRFWTYEIATYSCNGTTVYRLQHGFLKRHHLFETIYQWMYLVLGIVIPLVILSYCNIFLIKALRSMSSNSPYMPGSRGQESTQHITLTFVAIIIIYILLVTPSEVIGFLRKLIISGRTREEREKYNLLVDIFNTLQAVNFSLNFIVYCIINTSFRHTVISTFKCLLHPGSYMSQKEGVSHYTSVTTNTLVNGRQSFMMAAGPTPRASLI